MPHQRDAVASSRRPYQRGLVAGLLVVALGTAAYFFLRPARQPSNPSNLQTLKPSQITSVKPAFAHTNAPAAVAPDPTEGGRWKFADGRRLPADAYKDARGIWRHPGGARVFDPRDRERAIKSPTKSNIPKLKHPVEREIATLLTVKPGSLLVGTPRYDLLRKDLANALIDTIEITEADSERDRRIKEEVAATKKELIERLKNGEDVVQILKETREELQRLSQYKFQVQKLLNEQVRDAEKSDRDVEDAFAAANKMLAERGIAPISSTPVLKRRQRLLLNEAKKGKSPAASQTP